MEPRSNWICPQPLLSWRFCIELGEPVIIAEDDAIIAPKLKLELDKLLQNKNDLPSFLLLDEPGLTSSGRTGTRTWFNQPI